MALLIDIKQPLWMKDEELREQLLAIDPQADIRCGDDPGNPEDIEMLTVSTYLRGEALKYPNLKLVQKTGAGVDSIMADDSLPAGVRVARLRTDTSGQEMAEYALAYVLQEQRHSRFYQANQLHSLWDAKPPRRACETTVAVLGLGRIGVLVVNKFLDCDFKVIGWSRSQKSLPGAECFSGDEQLAEVLGKADYIVSILPSTPATTKLFNRETFASMKPSAFIINVGRGTLIDEDELLESLDAGLLGGAVLDVMQTEPLLETSGLWTHPKVILTPHVSGWHLGDAVVDIAENYRRIKAGEPLLNQINRELGY